MVSMWGQSVLVDGSFVFADTLGTMDGVAIGIDLEATEDVIVTNGALITTDVLGAGDAGDIQVIANSVGVSNGAVLGSRVFSRGNAGQITLSAPVVRIEQGGIITTQSLGEGRGGTIEVAARRLTVTGGAQISSGTRGAGPGGTTILTATEAAVISGSSSGLFNPTLGSGNAGRIHLAAPTVQLEDGGIITAGTRGSGHAGEVVIEVENLTVRGRAFIDGGSVVGAGPGGRITVAATNTVTIAEDGGLFGSAGEINLTAPSVRLENGGQIAADSFEDHAGTIVIDVGTLTLTSGSTIVSNVIGGEQGGGVTITATDSVNMSGSTSSILSQSISDGDASRITLSVPALTIEDNAGIVAQSLPGGGAAGDIAVEVGTLTLTGGAVIDSSTFSDAPGGRVTVTATDTVTITGRNSDDFRSGISVLSGPFGSGNAGRIQVSAPTLIMDDGEIRASTSGGGRGGIIEVQVETPSVTGGSFIESITQGPGPEGTVTVTATGAVAVAGRSRDDIVSTISSQTEGRGDAGNGMVHAGTLNLTDGGRIAANTLGPGKAGTVSVTATDVITIAGRDRFGFPSRLVSSAGGSGEGGNLFVSAPTVSMEDGGVISSQSLPDGGVAGDIVVEVGTLTLTGGAAIDSSTLSSSPAGRRTVTAMDTVTLSGQNSSLISATSGSGAGNDIVLTAHNIQLAEGAIIRAQSTQTGDAGSIFLTARDAFQSENSTVTSEAIATDGGNITLAVTSLVRLRDSQMTTMVSSGQGSGGNIAIDPEFVILENSQIIADAFGGRGGNIQITAGVFLAAPSSRVSASSVLGIDGQVDIRAPVTNLSGFITLLPPDFAPAAALLRNECAARLREGTVSSFIERGRASVPATPDGIFPSRLYALRPLQATPPGATPQPRKSVASRQARLWVDTAGQFQITHWPASADSLLALELTCGR